MGGEVYNRVSVLEIWVSGVVGIWKEDSLKMEARQGPETKGMGQMISGSDQKDRIYQGERK